MRLETGETGDWEDGRRDAYSGEAARGGISPMHNRKYKHKSMIDCLPTGCGWGRPTYLTYPTVSTRLPSTVQFTIGHLPAYLFLSYLNGTERREEKVKELFGGVLRPLRILCTY